MRQPFPAGSYGGLGNRLPMNGALSCTGTSLVAVFSADYISLMFAVDPHTYSIIPSITIWLVVSSPLKNISH
jgi:hypothetical protein